MMSQQECSNESVKYKIIIFRELLLLLVFEVTMENPVETDAVQQHCTSPQFNCLFHYLTLLLQIFFFFFFLSSWTSTELINKDE